MKTQFFSPKTFWILMLVFFNIIILSSCKDDDKSPLELLQGDWDVTSFTRDGSEQMKFSVLSYIFEFDKYRDGEGDFDWTRVTTDGKTVIFSGEYTVDNDTKELELDFNDGSKAKYDMEVSEDDLTLTSNSGGVRIIFEAERD